jgi:hypothetical protein
MKSWVTVSCVALALWIGHAERARACSCMEMDVPTAVERADAVFEGRVVEIVRGDPSQPVRVTLEVVQQWKGVDHERVVVETAADSAACGVAFEEGTSWLVYAQRAGDVLRADLCSRTKRIEDAGEDRAQLGAGVVPVDVGEDDGVEAPAHEPPARGGCASCSIVTRSPLPISGMLAMIAIDGLALRRRR